MNGNYFSYPLVFTKEEMETYLLKWGYNIICWPYKVWVSAYHNSQEEEERIVWIAVKTIPDWMANDPNNEKLLEEVSMRVVFAREFKERIESVLELLL